MQTRRIFCMPGKNSEFGATAGFVKLTPTRGVKLFRPEYKEKHVHAEAEIMEQASRLGLSPKVYGLVYVVNGRRRLWGIEVEVVDVCWDDYPRVEEGLRRRVFEKMGLIAADIRPSNYGKTVRGRYVVIDWSLARMIPKGARKRLPKKYLLSTENTSETARRSLAPNDPQLGVPFYE